MQQETEKRAYVENEDQSIHNNINNRRSPRYKTHVGEEKHNEYVCNKLSSFY